jgi:RHS repeat-associated protein
MTSDGVRTFEWDARNQLVAVNIGTHRSEFAYDGMQRRVGAIEKENGLTQNHTAVLWCDTAVCEERAADGVSVTRRAFGHGDTLSSQGRFYAFDHLGSVREVTDGTGGLLARYLVDPWGRFVLLDGLETAALGFAGHIQHSASGLTLALYRAYDASVGEWISEDPLGLYDGAHLFRYVDNRPTVLTDAYGLSKGGKGNIGVIHKGQELTKRSSVADVSRAIDEARREGMSAKHIKKMEGLRKVIKRGGRMGIACLLMDCDTYMDILDCIIHPNPDCYLPWRKPSCEISS